MTKELKRHKSIAEQVALLRSRGLIIQNEAAASRVLSHINYYRLSGYLHDFKQPGADAYVVSLTWERLLHIYDFDRKLTRILMYALEDIEESLKTRISYLITSQNPDDPMIYLNPAIYREQGALDRFRADFNRRVKANRKLPFVKHHIDLYGGKLPMWVAVELFTMGNLSAIYRNLLPPYQKAIARTFHTGPNQLKSWIDNLTYTRNHLAHYMRVYQFNFGRTPAKCRNHASRQGSSHMIFDQICIMSCLYSQPAEWNSFVLPEIKRVLDEYASDITLAGIGFPENWVEILTCPIPEE